MHIYYKGKLIRPYTKGKCIKAVTGALKLITDYKFDNTAYNLFPDFNEGFTYTYEDIVEDNITTRTIHSPTLPTEISFENSSGLLEVNYLDTSELTSTYNLFYNCTNLTYVNLSKSNFSKVETIERMFTSCINLVTIDGLNDLDVSKVHNMGGLFSDCRKLVEANVSKWDISNVTNFGAMFRRCYELTSLDINNWDTRNAKLMSGIFTNCSKLTSLDLSNWNTDNVSTINQMFYGCSKLTSVKLFNNLNDGVDVLYLFGKCDMLNEVKILNSDYNTVNTITSVLPTKTTDYISTLDISGIDDIGQVDIETLNDNNWTIISHTILNNARLGQTKLN